MTLREERLPGFTCKWRGRRTDLSQYVPESLRRDPEAVAAEREAQARGARLSTFTSNSQKDMQRVAAARVGRPLDAAEVRRLRDGGMTQRAIARQLRVSDDRVSRALREES